MVYAITIVTVAVFFAIYLLTREKPKEEYARLLCESDYNAACKNYVRTMPLPSESCDIKDKYFKRNVKLSLFILKNKKYKGMFEDFCANKDVLQPLLNADFSPLAELASVNGEPRSVKLARFCLESADYIFIADRVKTLFDEQNKMRTPTFAEILHMKEAFLYVLLEKTFFLLNDLKTLTKVMKIAKRYVEDEGNSVMDKRYKAYAKSKLFLSLCAIKAEYSGETHKKVFADTIDEIYRKYVHVLDSVQSVLYYDFSVHYSPLEIFDKFDSFSNATENQKINFLNLFSKLSDKENLDEFMYAIRAEKYIETSSQSACKVQRKSLFGRKYCIISKQENLSMLASALNSDVFMKIYFDDAKNAKKYKSMSKFVDFENTFEPIYKFSTVNFGLSVHGDTLRISPHLPKNVLSADLTFKAGDTVHNLKIKKGDEEKLYLGNTMLRGTHIVKLAQKPLNITVVVKE